MTDPNEMTDAERAAVLAAIEAQAPVRMRRLSDNAIIAVDPSRVAERIASGCYEMIKEAT
ncbi:hypothetical protein ABT369_39525 [Dactylosporangium sp. NPDC000244]|uniref:hypothetical protein n=1 Tax=Dactylosporangium sp. NPDC000244 TaxID=3154365 RepID=UPI0033237B53